MSADEYKRAAATRALDWVRDGMRLGLGTGSTARHFIDGLGARVASGLDVLCVPTSQASREQAARLQIPLAELDEVGRLDLTVDGADELDDNLCLIKGGGGALWREKIVAAASDVMLVIADESKLVARLGAFPLPVEVSPFGHKVTARAIAEKIAEATGAADVRPVLRYKDGEDAPFITEGGHYIYDCALGQIEDPSALAAALEAISGVVAHGLFINLATGALIAGADGVREIGESPDKP